MNRITSSDAPNSGYNRNLPTDDGGDSSSCNTSDEERGDVPISDSIHPSDVRISFASKQRGRFNSCSRIAEGFE